MSGFDRFVGIPYVDKGRSLEGFDCWGCLWLVFRDLRGIELPSHSGSYVTAADHAEVARLIAGHVGSWDQVPRGAERTFDGVLIREGRFARHIGVVTKHGRLLHVLEGETSRIEPYHSGRLEKRVVAFYRYRDNE